MMTYSEHGAIAYDMLLRIFAILECYPAETKRRFLELLNDAISVSFDDVTFRNAAQAIVKYVETLED